ncbi:hypothetical protein FGO68_gene7085 [Halteria grandinella]|uniref:Uncharacterized protein n=1 Tax=Halteria grandinella TaxID=5974 RepID=A0A8J8SXY7_HALGN|nr:hypothetical protein FGO68_gene7085 [Halteria grandinella]
MISTLLKSTINIDKVSSLRPIYLQISKLKDLYVFKTRADINNNFAEINYIVNLNGMKILRDRIITYSNQSTVYIMQLRLQNMQGRPLNLTINQQTFHQNLIQDQNFQIMSNMQQSIKPSASSIPPSIITVIQYYLHGNFVIRGQLYAARRQEKLSTLADSENLESFNFTRHKPNKG